ncbi:MAG: hypothetical protein ACTSVK_01470 [Promethearchaeota archaeon]
MYIYNVRWILDACSLISLIQSNQFENFINLAQYPIIIDTSVYTEVVVQGKKFHYPDAEKAELILKKYKIPIIPIDISNDLQLFRDPGETSCFVLGKESGITITADRRAYNKFLKHQIHVMKIEQFFFQKFKYKKINSEMLLSVLLTLEKVHAISVKEYYYFKELIQNNGGNV